MKNRLGLSLIVALAGLMLIGGVGLIWIARRLLQPDQESGHSITAAASVGVKIPV